MRTKAKENKFKFHINLITSIVCAVIVANILFTPVEHASLWGSIKSSIVAVDSFTQLLGLNVTTNDRPHAMMAAIYSGPSAAMIKVFTDFSVVKEARVNYIGIYTTFKGVGALWVIAVAMMHFFQNIERGRDEWESICGVLTEIAITGLFIMYIDRIMMAIVEVGEDLAMTAANSAAARESNIEGILDEMLITLTGDKEGTFQWWIQAVATLLLPYTIAKYVEVLGLFMAVQMQLDLAIRMISAPLAVADIYQEGLRSPGAKYLKKFFAIALKMSLAIIICAIGADLTFAALQQTASATGETLKAESNMFLIIATNGAALGAIKGLDGLVDDIAGV